MTADGAIAHLHGQTHGSRQSLTPREQQVLSWIIVGKSNAETAIIMGISPWTVKIHVANIYKKLNVSSRGQAVAQAVALRLLNNTN